MHQQRRPTRVSVQTRIFVGVTVAWCVAAFLLVSDDPTEALCALYDYPDAMWFILGCWRFPGA